MIKIITAVAVWWSKGDFSFLSMHVCVCLKIMILKDKQDYVRRITKRARERKSEEASRISGSKEKKKGEDVLMMGICVWWTKCKRKKRKCMDERKA